MLRLGVFTGRVVARARSFRPLPPLLVGWVMFVLILPAAYAGRGQQIREDTATSDIRGEVRRFIETTKLTPGIYRLRRGDKNCESDVEFWLVDLGDDGLTLMNGAHAFILNIGVPGTTTDVERECELQITTRHGPNRVDTTSIESCSFQNKRTRLAMERRLNVQEGFLLLEESRVEETLVSPEKAGWTRRSARRCVLEREQPSRR